MTNYKKKKKERNKEKKVHTVYTDVKKRVTSGQVEDKHTTQIPFQPIHEPRQTESIASSKNETNPSRQNIITQDKTRRNQRYKATPTRKNMLPSNDGRQTVEEKK